MPGSDEDPRRRALRLAEEAGREAGLDVSDATVLRVRTSSHVVLPMAGVVARVEAPGAQWLAERQVRVAKFLAERGAPVARLVRPDLQPFLSDDGAAVLWQRLEAVGEPDWRSLGEAVRALHDAVGDSPPADLPAIDPCRVLLDLLDEPSPWSGSPSCDELQRRAREVVQAWPSATRDDPLGRTVVHGDVHLENAIVTERGLVLVDLEDAAVGPASWDFVAPAVGVRRYGVARGDYRDFVSGYEDEPGSWPGFTYMQSVYELFSVAWAMRCSEVSPRMAEEATLRVESFLGRSDGVWTLS